MDELEKQSRLLTPQEKAILARILIEDLDPLMDSEVDQLWIAGTKGTNDKSTGRCEWESAFVFSVPFCG